MSQRDVCFTNLNNGENAIRYVLFPNSSISSKVLNA
jgi:hypothetical protein